MKKTSTHSNPTAKSPVRTFRSRPRAAREARPDVEVRGLTIDALAEQKTRPLVVEIGCGVGWHPIQYALEHPEKMILAIERTTEKFARFARRLETHENLRNRICAVHADAIYFLDENLPPASIDEVWILYPNPEMKKTNRRWFQTPFMNRLLQLMKANATLHLATNIESYANECRALAPDYGLVLESSRAFDKRTYPDWKPRTHFEKKYHDRGETLFDLKFRLEMGAPP